MQARPAAASASSSSYPYAERIVIGSPPRNSMAQSREGGSRGTDEGAIGPRPSSFGGAAATAAIVAVSVRRGGGIAHAFDDRSLTSRGVLILCIMGPSVFNLVGRPSLGWTFACALIDRSVWLIGGRRSLEKMRTMDTEQNEG